MPSFLDQHLGEFITLLVGVATWLITLGKFKAKLELIEEKVSKMDREGSSYAREKLALHSQQADFTQKKLEEVATDSCKLFEKLSEMHTSIRVIEAWITEHKSV